MILTRSVRHRAAVWVPVSLVVLFLLYLFPFCYTVRGVWLPWSAAESVRFHGRDFRGGMEVPLEQVEGQTTIGRALWPDGLVVNAPGYSPLMVAGSIPTVIVVETPAGSNHYRSYGLVGGP